MPASPVFLNLVVCLDQWPVRASLDGAKKRKEQKRKSQAQCWCSCSAVPVTAPCPSAHHVDHRVEHFPPASSQRPSRQVSWR